jgi:hypothetical protein
MRPAVAELYDDEERIALFIEHENLDVVSLPLGLAPVEAARAADHGVRPGLRAS